MGKTLYIKGKDGKMAGSVAQGGKTPPTVSDAPASVEADDAAPAAEYTAVYAAYQEAATGERPVWLLENGEGNLVLDAPTCAQALLDGQSPVIREGVASSASFDDLQRQAILAAQLGRSSRAIEKKKEDPYAEADEEAWRVWCNEQVERVQETNPDLADEYTAWADVSPRPTAVEFEALKRVRYQFPASAKSVDREMRTIAGYHDTTPATVMLAYRRAREAYLAMPEDERPEVPEWHTRGMAMSYFGKDTTKAPPNDPATQWAMYTALTDPDVTSNYVRSGRGYVVFDTETTGVESDAAILQITAVAYDAQGREESRISTYVHPGFQEDGTVYVGEENVVAITGITPETLEGAPSFGDIAPQVHELMDGRTLVAHNLMFDYPKVQRHLAEAGHDTLHSGPIVDTLRLARWTQPNPGVQNKEWKHNLETACKRAGVEFNADEAHDAAYDVDRTAALFFALRRAELGRQYPKPEPPTADA